MRVHEINRILSQIVVLAVFALIVLPAAAGDEPDGVSAIRTLYGSAEGAISNGEFRPVSIGFGREPGNLAKLYGDSATYMLVKAIKNESTEDFSVYTEYLYYPSGELAFVFERTNLTGSVRKKEQRFYLKEGKLIRYILDVDTERTIYDEELERWKAALGPFAADAQTLANSYNGSIGPLLESMASEPGSIVLSFGGIEDLTLLVEIGTQKAWEIGIGGVNAAAYQYPELQGGTLVVDFSYTGGAGIKYELKQDRNEGLLQFGATEYESAGGPWQQTNTVLVLPFDPEKQVAFEVPFMDGPRRHHSPDVLLTKFSLPQISRSKTGPAFAAEDLAERAQAGGRIQVSLLKRIELNYEQFYGLEFVSNDTSSPRLRALVSSEEGFDQVDILRDVPDLWEIQGHSVEKAVFDVFRAELDGECKSATRSVKKLEWLSSTELMVTLICDRVEKTVVAVYSPPAADSADGDSRDS